MPTAEAWETKADCGPDRYRDRSPRVWARSDTIPQMEAGPLNLFADGASFDRVILVVRYADGLEIRREFDRGIANETWLPPSRLTFPLPRVEERPTEILMAVDRPRASIIFSTAQLMTDRELAEMRTWLLALFGVIIGILLFPIFLDMAFYSVLRQRFVLWHALLVGSAALYTISSSGIIMLLFPDLDLQTRWHINNWATVLAVAAAGEFLLTFLEPHAVARWPALVMRWAPAVTVAVTLLTLHGGEPFRLWGRSLWYGMYLPWLAAYAALLFIALRRGSRAAWFLLIGWSGLVLTAGERVLRQIGIFTNDGSPDINIYITAIIEVVVTTMGVADRFLAIRRQRDHAAARETELKRLADTDGQTGLLNRRAFERRLDSKPGTAIALIDIDRFKAINDSLGHAAGDDAIRALASVLRGAKSEHVLVCRLGGEEFALSFAGPAAAAAEGRVETLRADISLHASKALGGRRVTVSAGLAPASDEPLSTALKKADEALYRAKEAGRDRMAVWGEPLSGDGSERQQEDSKPSVRAIA